MILRVKKNLKLADAIWQMEIEGDFPYNKVQAGQFINIRVGQGHDHLLRRPISIAEVRQDEGYLTIVYRVVGQGTKWLSRLEPDMPLDILGPLGNGFTVEEGKYSLIVGGGIGIPPLYELAKRLSAKVDRLDIILGFRSEHDVFWIDRFKKLASVDLFTEDGSLGTMGFVTKGISEILADKERHIENIYACGPIGMLSAIKGLIGKLQIGGGASLEERMACGVGACYGCTCMTTNRESKRVCADGPVFSWQEVDL